MNILRKLENIFRLGLKELVSLAYDPVLSILILYSFTFAVYSPAKNAQMELANASVAIVDEDRSTLSLRIHDALLAPFFFPPGHLSIGEIDEAMDNGRYTFILDIPPNFQADLVAHRHPTIQINVDATAMAQAGTGSGYLSSIISQEVRTFLGEEEIGLPVKLVTRAMFNPNLQSTWFLGISQIVNNITLLAIILTGAALIREREHGTMEHLLVLPLTPSDIMIAKVWANGLVIVVAAAFSLKVVVQWALGVPIAGSLLLFLGGTVLYLFSVTALGIFLATISQSMPQFGLLAIPVYIVMSLLSGGNTPLDSMPEALQVVMYASPATHFMSIAQGILFRGAGLDVMWPEFAAVAGIGAAFFLGALMRFRASVAAG
ncbi:MAG: ABC transporter permease [Nitrospira sp.]|nr:ABC transporter permease [Nitrospira sp.]